jgi:hypothetical protein
VQKTEIRQKMIHNKIILKQNTFSCRSFYFIFPEYRENPTMNMDFRPQKYVITSFPNLATTLPNVLDKLFAGEDVVRHGHQAGQVAAGPLCGRLQ